mgnify:CR=1 FL=1
MNTKKMKSSLLEDLSKDILKDVELGECKAWSFTNSRGDTILRAVITCRLILTLTGNIL